MSSALAGLVIGIMVACAEDSREACPPGGIDCGCFHGTCLPGLTCLTDICVDVEADNRANPCAALLECAVAAEPSLGSSVYASYGPSGTCFDMKTDEQCWAECEALREDLAVEHFVLECAYYQCGNGEHDVGEMCDSADPEACDPRCQYVAHDCNPFAGLGCDAGFRCDVYEDDEHWFACLQGAPGTAGMGENCTFQECATETPICGSMFELPQCDFDYCCSQYCYLGATSLENGCPAGYSCEALPTAFTSSPWRPGAEDVGVCH